MIMLAVVIVLGIAWGLYGGKVCRNGGMSVEDLQLVREDCYKLAELRRKDKVRKFPASAMLIYGVMRQGVKKPETGKDVRGNAEE